jgi:hypothetical protein
LEDSAKTRREKNGYRGKFFHCSQLRMLPMHAWGQVSRPTKGGIPLAIS